MSEFAMVRFSEMARQVKTKVKPADTDLDRYVGLEHLDPESLHIRRWGVPGDVTGEKIVVRKGDIIFGKRRAYQRKVAIADFDCICSAHAMVLQPKEGVVIRELFPFFLQSDIFMNRAVQISVGGLSPTINWKDLAGQEFPLPPIEEQRRIAGVLWVAEDVIVKNEALVAALEKYKNAILSQVFDDGKILLNINNKKNEAKIVAQDGCQIKKLGDISKEKMANGLFVNKDKFGDGNLFFNVVNVYKNITLSKQNEHSLDRVKCSKQEIKKYSLHNDDLIFVRSSLKKEGIGQCCIVKDTSEPIIYDCHLIRVRVNEKIAQPLYLAYYFNSKKGKAELIKRSKSTTMTTLDQGDLSDVRVRLPPLDRQIKLSTVFSAIDDTIAAARASVEASKALKMRLINEFLSSKKGEDHEA